MINIAMLGASGRMGRSVCALAEQGEAPRFRISGRWDEQADALEAALAGADVAIDFTHASALPRILSALRDRPTPLVTGTTGIDADGQRAIRALAEHIPVLQDGNMSVAVQLMCALSRQAAQRLADYDLEISERHHRDKRDAPSGTALKIAEAAAEGRGQRLAEVAEYSRHGDAPRTSGSIGFAVQRGGGVIGEHTLSLLGDWDMLEIRHRALDRRLFADGALRAAAWLVSQKPGLYAIHDLIADF